MNVLLQLGSLTALIIREGNFRHSNPEYAAIRQETLRDLSGFFPPNAFKESSGIRRQRIYNNKYVRLWIGNAAFIKHSLRTIAGHLSAPALNLCYIRNPKAASTALSCMMLEARFPALKDHALSPQTINFLADVNLNKQLLPGESKSLFFTLVRNPFARIVSVYREFFERKEGHFIYDDYLFGVLGRGLSFKEFVRRVEMIPHWLKDQHLKPQYQFLRYYEARAVTVKIFRVEEPGEITAFLSGYGLSLREINKSETPYDYMNYYDKDTVEAVLGIYGKDISTFGYEAVYTALKSRF